MENAAEKMPEMQNYFSRNTGLNFELPKSMSFSERQVRYQDINKAISKEDRAVYMGKVIPFAEQERILKGYKPQKTEEGALKRFGKTTGKSLWNTTIDAATAPYRALSAVGVSLGAKTAELVADVDNPNITREAALEAIDIMNPDYDVAKFDTGKIKPYSAEWAGQGVGSVATPLILGLAGGFMPNLALTYGLGNYAENTQTMLEGGENVGKANIKGAVGGALETALEMLTINKFAAKIGRPILQRYAARFGTGSMQEYLQEKKDQLILGKYDTRTEEEKRDAEIAAIVFGGFGELAGLALRDSATRKVRKDIKKQAVSEGISEKTAAELAATSTLDEKPDFKGIEKQLIKEANERQDLRRAEVYDKFVESGDEPEVAAAKANELVPTVEAVESEVLDSLRNGTFITNEEKEDLRQAYTEAVERGGEDAAQYLAAKDGLQEKITPYLGEEKAKGEAQYWTGMAIKDYQLTKEQGGYAGNFEEFADQYYKFNKLRIVGAAQMSEADVDEAFREHFSETGKMVSDEERYREESGRGKLFSKSNEEIAQEEIQQKVFAKDVQAVIKEAEKKIPSTKIKAGFGSAKNWLVTVSKRLGLDIEGYKHIVDAQSVRHIFNRHGEGSETRDKQIPVTNQDIENIPNVVNSPDYLVYGNKTDGGRETIGYLKTVLDGSTYYVEEIRDKEKQLAAKTMYKIEGVAAENLISDSVGHTSETAPSAVRLIDKLKKSTVVPAFTKNIASGNTEVKENNKLYSKEYGSYDRDTQVVELMAGHNPSTLTHELSHHFFINHIRLMDEMGLHDRNKPLFDWLSKKGGHTINSLADIQDSDWETMTEAFVEYLNTGDAPNLATKSLFQRAKEWLLDEYKIHRTEASPEIRDYFDSLVSRETAMPDLTALSNQTAKVAEILRQAKNGESATFKDVGKRELGDLQRALHTRIRRKGMSLKDELIASGGIKEGTELAKALGFDVLKKDKMFSNKDSAIAKEDELIGWLADKGYITSVQEGENAENVSARWNEVQKLIDNAENVYTPKEQAINQERETAIRNQAHAQEIVDTLLKDNKLGLKSIEDLDDLLSRVISKPDDVDIVKVNAKALKYIDVATKDANRLFKEQLKKKDNQFKNAREEQYQAQNDLKDYIRSLPINGQHKVSLMGNIQRVKDYDTLKKVYDSIKPRVDKYVEQEEKGLLQKNINTLLSGTYQRGIKNKKFTYEGNKLFEELRGINLLSKEKATDELFNRLKQGKEVVSEAEKLERRLLEYKISGKDMSVENMKGLAFDLASIIQEDIKTREDFDAMKGNITRENVEYLVSKLNSLKASSKFNLLLAIKNGDFYSMMNEIGGKEFADKFNMRVDFANQEEYLTDRLSAANEKGADIYGVNYAQYMDLLQELSDKKYIITPNDDYGSDSISKMEIMHMYLLMKQPDTRELVLRNYEEFDEEGNQLTTQIDDLISNLTKKDIEYAQMLQEEIAKDYDVENKAYIFRNGVDMPNLEDYFPRKSRKLSPGEDSTDAYANLALQIPSFYKKRGKNAIPIFQNVWEVFKTHKADASYAVNVFPKYLEIYKVLNNSKVRHLIENKYGDKIAGDIQSMVNSMGAKAYKGVYSSMNDVMSKLAGNWIRAKIGINPAVYVKQLISVTNYAENMPVAEFIKNMNYALAHPVEAYNFMQDVAGDFINTRFKLGRQNEVLARQLATDEDTKQTFIKASTKQNINDAITYFVRVGDIAPIIYGGYARTKYLMEKEGKTIEEARDIFRDETLRSQQASSAATTSNFQKQGGISKFITAFQNTPMQYARILAEVNTQHKRGEISDKQYYKTVFNYMFIQPFLLALATNGFYNLLHDDDDDKDLISVSDIALGAITSLTGGVPMANDVLKSYWTAAQGDRPYGVNIGIFQDFTRSSLKLLKKEKDVWDYADIAAPFVEALTAFPQGVITRYAKSLLD